MARKKKIRKKRVRFDYDKATLEELRAYRQRLFESNKKLFGWLPRERYKDVTERFGLPSMMGETFLDPYLERREVIKQISIMTGGYEYHRAKDARDSLTKMLDRLGANEAMKGYVKKLSLSDIQYHSEEYNYLFRLLSGYALAIEQDVSDESEILGDIADTFLDIERRKREALGEALSSDDEIELLSEWGV